MSPKTILHFSTTILLLCSMIIPTSSLEFIFNTNFTSTNLLTYGTATTESSILSLANDTTFTIGRALYPSRIPTKEQNSSTPLPFSTSFIFSIVPYKNRLPGHGFAFVFFPSTGIHGASSAQHLGLFNLTNDGSSSNHVLAVEFDTFMNQEFNDVNDNHVGVDVNSLTSVAQYEAGFWEDDEKFQGLKLNDGVNYQAWIDYKDSRINVTMAKAGARRPKKPLISELVNISGVFLDEMYVGFCGATGQLVQSHKILSWSYSNTNFSIGDALVTRHLPSFATLKKSVSKSTGFIVGVSICCVLVMGCGIAIYVVFTTRKRRNEKKEKVEDWELQYWPHRIEYQKIYAATKGFRKENVIGFGGNGNVYKGILEGVEVAVKRMSHQSEQGMREFLAEVSSLGRLKHRNLVTIRGWCKAEKGGLILVYEYMQNGSLDKKIFECDENSMLTWEERIKVLKDVASGILYLHDGWETKVLHRDIKASNILLDKNMNARLGDFGLARMHHHGQLASTTRVVGTAGYMAPELVRSGRASTQTDVFSFGVLVLEVACGRRPIEEGKPGLVDFVWRLNERSEVMSALDDRIKAKEGYSIEEVERVLHLGLLCAHPNPNVRPTMRQAVKVLDGVSEAIEPKEGIEVHLLDEIRTSAMWSRHYQNSASRSHPTMNDVFKTLSSSSISLSSSDVIAEGR